MLQVSRKEIRTLADLEELKSAWEKLEQGRDMTIFQSFSWNTLLFEQWRSSIYNRLIRKVYIYIVEDGGGKNPISINCSD